MNGKGHTPGPWFAVRHKHGSFAHRITKTPDSASGDIANALYGLGAITGVEANANALLIAAAPDLLSALLMVLDDPNALDGRPRTAEYVHAAIAKATGANHA